MLKILAGLVAGIVILAGLAWLNQAQLVRWLLDLPAYQSERKQPQTVQLEMRDGTRLETHIYQPQGAGPWPTVLIRDPYSTNAITCRLLPRYNYACVHQDTRGRFGSGGEWYPVINERNDGLDTLEWLVAQPWQDGNIATMGGSYVGLVQWAMIDEMPEQVKTVMADVSHGDWYRIVHRGGHFVQGVMSAWALGLHHSESTLEDIAAHRPAINAGEKHLGGVRQWYQDMITNPDKSGQYWQAPVYRAIRTAHQRADMPVLMTAGWHDFFIAGQLSVFEELPRRKQSLLVIRNGGHGAGSVGEALELVRFSLQTTMAWLDHHLKGASASQRIRPGYLLQDNVDGGFRHHESWPRAYEVLELHLAEMADAGNCDGGSLSTAAPVSKATAQYMYDPENPVPSIGGSYHFGAAVVEQGDDNCSRPDVLSFESEVFSQGLQIIGAIGLRLRVASDAEDSAFSVKLQEKTADGRVLNIRDDITSLSYRDGAVPPHDYQPGSEVELAFQLVPIKWRLQPGSTLRLDVSSSNFPFYNAHPNLKGPWWELHHSKVARQTVFSGKVVLPHMSR